MQDVRDTLWYDDELNALVIIDQTQLPNNEVTRVITDEIGLVDAISSLAVRGAPAIGVAAAIGCAVAASRLPERDFEKNFTSMCERVAAARPTAVNLRWAVERLMRAFDPSVSAEESCRRLLRCALEIRDEDISVCTAIGDNGVGLLKDGYRVLTHCNAGRLAAVRYGTALAPVYRATERGMKIKVYADETRPLLQGARLTAYELSRAGIDVTVQCDSMAASLMAAGMIDAVFVGCDRCAANGDFANKIGTLPLAIVSRRFSVPFYVCLPVSSVDLNAKNGSDIVVEQRAGYEVSVMWYARRMTPEGVSIYNPAFDVTPSGLVTAYITEKGVFCPDGSR